MKTLKLLALSLVASFVMAAQAAEVYQVQLSSNLDVMQPQSTQYLSYYFGVNWVHTRRVARFDVMNTTAAPLTFAQAYITGPGFGAVHSCSGVLMPQQHCWFEIEYWPYFEGVHYGRFVLSFVEGSNVAVNVWGEARRW